MPALNATGRETSLVGGLAHVAFTVADVNAAVEFFGALFEREPEVRAIYDRPYTAEQVGYTNARLDIAIFTIPRSGVRLELIQYLHPIGEAADTETMNPGTAHICLITDDLEAMFDRIVALGGVPRSTGPVRITSGPNAGSAVCYVRDPQGLTIELLQRSKPEGANQQ
jgi:catechol 2,3-dioxygenase-like lactoylglutathione lyase family enzyme